MSGPRLTPVARPYSSVASARVAAWLAVAVLAVVGGVAASWAPTTYVLAFVALMLVVALFLWRSQSPMVPFLLLAAAIPGGVLLQLSLGDAPIATLMPVFGGWALAAALLAREPNHLLLPASDHGKHLPRSLVAFAMVVALTAIAQNWRPAGHLPDISAVLTLVQLGILVCLAAYVLSSPQRVMWVAYVTIAAGTAVAAVALANQAGLLTIGTEMAYREGYTRVSGLEVDPNFFSFQLLVALAFAIHVGLATKRILGRVLVWSAFGVIFAGIVSSYSAGALVGVAAVLGVTVLLQLRVSGKRALTVLVLIAVVTTVVAATAPAEYTDAVKAKYSGIADSSFEQLGTSRGAAWEAALRGIASNPAVGAGLSTSTLQAAIADHYTLYRTEKRAAHNMYLGIAVGTGVFGLACFLVVLGSCLSVLWCTHGKATGGRQSETALATACLFTALVAAAAQGLQLDLQFGKYLWLLIGASLAVRHWPLCPCGVRG